MMRVVRAPKHLYARFALQTFKRTDSYIMFSRSWAYEFLKIKDLQSILRSPPGERI